MKEKLERCGACGEYQQDPKLYSEEEVSNVSLIHCGCESEQPHEPSIKELHEAGIISLDSDGNPH